MNKWNRVEDKLPDINDDGCSHFMLLWTTECDEKDDVYLGYLTNRGWIMPDYLENETVTHWMELPESPE